MANERSAGMYFKVSEKEADIIKERMKLFGTENKSAFLRKMACDGYIINLDWTALKELLSLLRITSNNVDQIAKRCNETSNLYEEDVDEIRQRYNPLSADMEKVLHDVAELNQVHRILAVTSGRCVNLCRFVPAGFAHLHIQRKSSQPLQPCFILK